MIAKLEGTRSRDGLICPYCEAMITETWEMEDEGVCECGECGEEFNYHFNYVRWHYAEPIIKKDKTMKEIHGCLITLAKKGEFDVIVHGCNCMCVMSAGIAKAIKEAFPSAYKADLLTKKADWGKLGTCSFSNEKEVTIVNAYTQFHFGTSNIMVRYDAVRSCLAWVKRTFSGSRIGLPQIGCGFAGGDWETVKDIIADELKDEDVTIVYYHP